MFPQIIRKPPIILESIKHLEIHNSIIVVEWSSMDNQ